MIKIYCFGPMDRSGRVRWLLEEMGIAYQDQTLDYHKKEHKGEEYLKLNPMGSVPTVELEGQVLTESGAICVYLADKYSDHGLAPALDSPDRGMYLKWMFFIPATAEPVMTEGFLASQLPEEERSKAFAKITERFAPVVNTLCQALKDKEYIIGGKFSAADIMVGSTLNWAKQFQLLHNQPQLETYLQNLKARPAAEKSGVFLPITPS